ncbi:Aste57867_9521 [Aphanomyces stellatus]|uniref:Aste57867_9521 protein n=1 Tax=Aphanomyces stellatus TaxID=120398 RepID=A0A485KNJ1_9STRA|nr:hypothetical protein As57867_009484 [Aphanomyces stellatus]VFT86400.1 Aste57867_9521 [Aphanomyces stellatus]
MHPWSNCLTEFLAKTRSGATNPDSPSNISSILKISFNTANVLVPKVPQRVQLCCCQATDTCFLTWNACLCSTPTATPRNMSVTRRCQRECNGTSTRLTPSPISNVSNASVPRITTNTSTSGIVLIILLTLVVIGFLFGCAISCCGGCATTTEPATTSTNTLALRPVTARRPPQPMATIPVATVVPAVDRIEFAGTAALTYGLRRARTESEFGHGRSSHVVWIHATSRGEEGFV